MNQLHAAAMGVFAILFGLLTIGNIVAIESSWDAHSPEDEQLKGLVQRLIGTIGGTITIGYLAATIGLGSGAIWGRGTAFLMQPVTALTIIGLPVVIWQLVTLTRPAPQR